MNVADDDIVREFLEESRDNLDQLDRDLVALEGRPTDPALLAQVFRTIHTIKGTCGFLGYDNLEALTHAGESLLSALRDGELVLDEAITTSLLHLVDAVRGVLGRIESTGSDADDDHVALITALGRHTSAVGPANVEALRADPVEPVAPRGDATVRIDVTVLDKLMDLVGELVVARSQIGVLTDDDDEGPLAAPYRQLRLVTNELREGVMQARLQPIGVATGKVRRVVRDLAADLGKQILVVIEGEDVGVDKTVNEALRDPLLHLVRNAVDHGIELPDERVRAGKPAHGTVTIRAFHEGGRVHVHVSDDGQGIDADRLVQRAVASGLVSDTVAASLTSTEARDLMFRAGLSTKDDITTVSGRGVGMDVVMTALQNVGGAISVTSAPGVGTLLRISLPLTLAVVPTLIVRCNGARYVVPQVDVQEIVRCDDEAAGATLSLRGRDLALFHLGDHLGEPSGRDRAGCWVVVVQTDGKRFGVVVGAIDDTTETIVKPLPVALRGIPVFAGVTILGEGHPALVLDVAGLAQSVDATADTAPEERLAPVEEAAEILVVHDNDGTRSAIPLAIVRRVEEVPAGSIETSSGVAVMAHQGLLIPVIDLAGHRSASVVPVVVCESSVGLIGLAVGRFDDVVAGVTSDASETGLVDVEALVVGAGLGATA